MMRLVSYTKRKREVSSLHQRRACEEAALMRNGPACIFVLNAQPPDLYGACVYSYKYQPMLTHTACFHGTRVPLQETTSVLNGKQRMHVITGGGSNLSGRELQRLGEVK